MTDLTTRYMGLELPSPLVVASSSISNRPENFAAAEASGAGAIVLRSLFEEQIEAAESALEEAVSFQADANPEARSYLPPQRIGPREYLRLLDKAKKSVRIPVIASLNAAAAGSWSEYAKQLEDAGANAIEVNIYQVGADPSVTGEQIEKECIQIVRSVRKAVKVPIALKLSPYFTSFANVAKKFDDEGVNGLVLFNRFLQPDIDLDRMALNSSMQLSHPWEMLVPLRWTAILYGRVNADIAASTGVHDAAGVVKMILAGATVVQLAASLLRNGITHLAGLRSGLSDWMERGHYSSLGDFRGSLSQKEARDPRAFERAQYVNLILSQNT
ncbi:MAG TPA: dihydroorotate dehydrogenase-like protein [Anaeromyxobacteraceae bacterium]|nr:dihydroorotate dehydrogenase-like protein [Anaeromyxobacteraceae bacterium]